VRERCDAPDGPDSSPPRGPVIDIGRTSHAVLVREPPARPFEIEPPRQSELVTTVLPIAIHPPGGLLPRRGRIPDSVALERVRFALDAARGNRAQAARDLGVSRATLYRWLTRRSFEGAAP
jgi:transcriptional regulator with AAA-type ATPase domain